MSGLRQPGTAGHHIGLEAATKRCRTEGRLRNPAARREVSWEVPGKDAAAGSANGQAGGSPSTGLAPSDAISAFIASCAWASASVSVPLATSATPCRPSGRSKG